MASKHKQQKRAAGVRVHYQPGLSGEQEILRPTLVNVNGRSYRKLTGSTFGRKEGVETGTTQMGDPRGRRPVFVGK